MPRFSLEGPRRAKSFVCTHTLCMNYVTSTFLLVRSSVRSKELLCFVQGQGQKGEQNHTTNNFVGFHNHSPLLTMCKPNKIANQQNKTPPKILCYTVAHCNIWSWDFIHRIAAWRTSSNFAAILSSLLKSSQSPLASPNRNSLWFAKFRSSGSALNTYLVLLLYGDSSVLHCASLVRTISRH